MGAFTGIRKLDVMPETAGQLTDLDLSECKEFEYAGMPCEIYYGVGDGSNTTYQITTGFEFVLGGWVHAVSASASSVVGTVKPGSTVGVADVVVPTNNLTYFIVVFGNKRPNT